MARRGRQPIKWEYKPSWRYVRERLMDPQFCAKGSYRTLTSSNTPNVPSGVHILTCCVKGRRRNKSGRCCSGGSCSSGQVQSIRHSVERFRFRHPDIWKRLKRASPGRGGVKVVRAGGTPARRRKAV